MNLATSMALSVYYTPRLIQPHEVIAVLNSARIKFVLVGSHGFAGWTNDPRATQDIDVLIAQRRCNQAISSLRDVFPGLKVEESDEATKMRDPQLGRVVIDVLKANQPLYRNALKHTTTVAADGYTYSIPSLEMALAMKFAAMISLTRADEDKFQDASDFIKIVKANPTIDVKRLQALGEEVYSGGGAELVEKVRAVRAGEKLKL
jgi:hypothetical protein